MSEIIYDRCLMGDERFEQAVDEALGENHPPSVIHLCPPGDGAEMPCCGRTPFEVSRDDRMTTDLSLVTCEAKPCP